jgi:uncharacterized RDD family membrane protein YckC
MSSSDVYHLKWKGQRSGPFSLREIDEKVQRREVSSLHEIEVDGKWVTVRAFMARRAPVAAHQAAPSASRSALTSHASFESAPFGETLMMPGAARPTEVPSTSRASAPPASPYETRQQAGRAVDDGSSFYLRSKFTLRVLATMLDAAVFLAGVLAMQKLRWINLGNPPTLQDVARMPDGIWLSAWLLACWGGAVLMEGSPLQASIGKWMLGLAVVDRNGMQLSTAQAFKRGVLKMLGGLPFGFGWFMAAFNQEARCMHDMVADTHVVLRVNATRIFH